MTVFANGLEISAKAQGCKVIAAFPDPCFTPPQTPATPIGVPVPYPDFGKDSDLTKGSTKVKIGGQEISRANISKYSKCTGDEAGAAPKKGLITSQNKGAIYAQKWSMDVKVEGEGVVRFSDIATGNHASNGPDSAPNVFAGKPGQPGHKDTPDCLVGQYDDIVTECNNRGGQAHHIIPDEYLRTTSRPVAEKASDAFKANGTPDPTRRDSRYPPIGAACAICVGGSASGRMASEMSKTTSADTGAAYLEKAVKTHPKFLGYNNTRGHGFAHFAFDSCFGPVAKPIGYAVELAQFALVELASFPQSAVDADCALAGMECIQEQFKEALKAPQPTCERNHRDSPALDERLDKLGVDRAAIQKAWASRASSLGYG